MGNNPSRASCVVEQLWPGITLELASDQLRRLVRTASDLPVARRPQVVGATLVPDDEILFIWCDAPSTESVHELLTRSDIQVDRVLPVVHALVARSSSMLEISGSYACPMHSIATSDPAEEGG